MSARKQDASRATKTTRKATAKIAVPEERISDKVYKKIEVVGCSGESIEKAIELAIGKASESLHGVSWFEVVEIRGAVRNGRPVEWQVTANLGFKVD